MQSRETEIRQAIQAADNTLYHLNKAKGYLDSAGNWGILDILGGGFISTLAKHGKMHDAEYELTQARDSIRLFARELRDVNEMDDIDIAVDDFLGFADYFFDGLIADWMMQSRIGKAQSQVDEAIWKVNTARDRLNGLL
ncbi:MAG: hypothetical protein Q4D04_07165 [Clostridia bacterium]|nr:hypothetical protein [Clostridia bacterium]